MRLGSRLALGLGLCLGLGLGLRLGIGLHYGFGLLHLDWALPAYLSWLLPIGYNVTRVKIIGVVLMRLVSRSRVQTRHYV